MVVVGAGSNFAGFWGEAPCPFAPEPSLDYRCRGDLALAIKLERFSQTSSSLGFCWHRQKEAPQRIWQKRNRVLLKKKALAQTLKGAVKTMSTLSIIV